MKILIAAHHFPPKHIGGAELRAFRTARALQTRGHQVRVICVERIDDGPIGDVSWQDELYEGIQVRRLSFNLSASPDPFLWQYDNPWIGNHLQAYFKNEKPDIFHLFSGYLMSASPLRAARQAGVLCVVSLTDFWFLCPRITMIHRNGQISRLPLKSVNCARCLGEEYRRYRIPGKIMPGLMGLYWHLQKKRIHAIEERLNYLRQSLNQTDAIISASNFLRSVYIEAGINGERILSSSKGFDPDNSEAGLLPKYPSSRLRLGYIGQIAEHKGVHILLKAVGLLPNAPLIVKIFGDITSPSRYRQQLQQMAARDKRVEFVGSFNHHEINRVMQDLDVVVVPSLWYEASPNVILEAFANKTPVIASNLGGMVEMVSHDVNGLVFEPGSPQNLAVQIQRLVDEPALVGRLSSGIQAVKGFPEEIDELEAVYRRLSRLSSVEF